MKLKKILKITALIGASTALAITLINDKKKQEEEELNINEGTEEQ